MHVHSPGVVAPAVIAGAALPSSSTSTLLTNVHLPPSTMRFLSVSHCLVALVIVVLQILATWIAETNSDSNSVDRIYSTSSAGGGIWCGVFFALTGLVGWMTARQKSNCYLISFLTMSVVCVIPFCALALAAASHDLAERYYLFCNHRFSASPPDVVFVGGGGNNVSGGDLGSGGAIVVPCSRHYGAMVCLNALLLVMAVVEVSVAAASIVVSSKALHRGRGCVCCCGCCYDAFETEAATASFSPPTQSFVIYTRGNLISTSDQGGGGGGGGAAAASTPHAILALPPGGVRHPQYFSFHAPEVSSVEAPLDLTGARYTADGVAASPTTDAVSNGVGLLVGEDGRIFCSRSPPPSYEESIKR